MGLGNVMALLAGTVFDLTDVGLAGATAFVVAGCGPIMVSPMLIVVPLVVVPPMYKVGEFLLAECVSCIKKIVFVSRFTFRRDPKMILTLFKSHFLPPSSIKYCPITV